MESNIHFKRAEVLYDQGRYDLAEKELRQEIAINPDFPNAYSLLGLCLIHQKKFAPDLKAIKVGGRFQSNKHKSTEALTAIQQAIQLNPTNDWFHSNLATYWYHRGEYDRAKIALNEAIKLNPNSAYYFYLLACIFTDQGERNYQVVYVNSRGTAIMIEKLLLRYYLRNTFAPIKQSLSIDPNYIYALTLYTTLLIRTGSNKAALEISSQALNLDPENAIAHKNHGLLLTINGSYLAAVEYFQTALQIDPNLKDAKNGLLEALRSRYAIYHWLSLTNNRGKAIFLSVIPIMFAVTLFIRDMTSGSVNIKTPLELVIYAIGITIIIFSFSASWTFNYLLQFDQIGKSILTKQDVIISGSCSVLALTFLSAIHASMCFDDTPSRTFAMNLVGIIGSAFIPIVNLPCLNNKSRIQYLGVTAIVWIVGIFNIICLLHQQAILNITGYSYTFLVLTSPLVAIRLDRKSIFK